MTAPLRLSRFLAHHAGQRMDLDVDFRVGSRIVGFRMVVLPGRDAAMTRLCTHLPRTPFFARLGGPPLSVSLANRVPVQGVEVLGQPASVRHRKRAQCRRPDLGESLRGLQTPDGRTRLAIAALAACEPIWASPRLLTATTFNSGAATKPLKPRDYTGGENPNRSYDVSPDGRRFLMIKAASADPATVPPNIIVVSHFDEELKRVAAMK